MVSVRHKTASGRFDELWDYDVAERRVEAMVRTGNTTTFISVDVCALAHPRRGAYAVQQLDGETWEVLPGQAVPIVGLAPGDHLVLCHCPEAVSAELALL